jgi:hypothetical protein
MRPEPDPRQESNKGVGRVELMAGSLTDASWVADKKTGLILTMALTEQKSGGPLLALSHQRERCIWLTLLQLVLETERIHAGHFPVAE